MEREKMAEGFAKGIRLPGGLFRPLYYLTRVDEPEFGCEGRPEGGRICGRAYGFDAGGEWLQVLSCWHRPPGCCLWAHLMPYGRASVRRAR